LDRWQHDDHVDEHGELAAAPEDELDDVDPPVSWTLPPAAEGAACEVARLAFEAVPGQALRQRTLGRFSAGSEDTLDRQRSFRESPNGV
jgi:hypothetical protein